MNNKKVIFVGGSPYSGSTLLDMMLASGKGGFSAGDVYAMFYPYRSHHANPECGCGSPDCTRWKEIKPLGPENICMELFKRFPGILHIVDSSKDPFWIRDQAKRLERHGLNARHVVIWKTQSKIVCTRLKRRNIKGWGSRRINSGDHGTVLCSGLRTLYSFACLGAKF